MLNKVDEICLLRNKHVTYLTNGLTLHLPPGFASLDARSVMFL